MFDWIASVAIKKGLNRGLKTGLAGLVGTLGVLQQFGIKVEVDQAILANALAGAIIGIYEILRNYQKSKGREAVQLP